MTDREALVAALADVQETLEDSTGILIHRSSPILAAARELLAGQNVWWCLEHDDCAWRSAYNTAVPSECSYFQEFDPPEPCRMVEAVLVIPDEKGEKPIMDPELAEVREAMDRFATRLGLDWVIPDEKET